VSRASEHAHGTANSLLAANHARRFSRVLTAAAAVGLFFYLVSYSSRKDEPIVTAPVEEPGDAVTAGHAEEPPPVPVPDATVAFEGGPIRVELVTRAQCWVSARVDGERVVSKLLQPGERHTLDITDEVVLRVGEPGALSVSINGQAGRPLGPAGQPVTVRITRDNFREFLSS
jgi:hypothetical protein